MIDKLKNNAIITALAFVVAVSFIFLAAIEQRQQDYDYRKDWWVLYFKDIKSRDFNFVVENHGPASSFHWSATSGKDRPFQEGDIEVENGKSLDVAIDTAGREDKKITIRVSDGNKAKEIYKDFRK